MIGVKVTAGGSGYTIATVSTLGANYKNITFVDCDFGGKQIRIDDLAQLDTFYAGPLIVVEQVGRTMPNRVGGSFTR